MHKLCRRVRAQCRITRTVIRVISPSQLAAAPRGELHSRNDTRAQFVSLRTLASCESSSVERDFYPNVGFSSETRSRGERVSVERNTSGDSGGCSRKGAPLVTSPPSARARVLHACYTRYTRRVDLPLPVLRPQLVLPAAAMTNKN